MTVEMTETVPERQIRRYFGTRAYNRAYEVISSGRMHSMRSATKNEGTSDALLMLSAEVESTAPVVSTRFHSSVGNSDYQVSAAIAIPSGKIVSISCTCPAFNRMGAGCKHTVALIKQYNEHPELFLGSSVPRSPLREKVNHKGTTRILRRFMRQRDAEQSAEAKSRQIALLKEVSTVSEVAGGHAHSDMHKNMPDGSVRLRPSIECAARGWSLRLRILVPSHNINYVVKDIQGMIDAFRAREYFSYGQRLSFIHTMEALAPRSREVLGIIDRALEIRKSLASERSSGYYAEHYQPKIAALSLSDSETAELLELFVGSDETIDYAPPQELFEASGPAHVVDGDPDLGIRIVPEHDSTEKPDAFGSRSDQDSGYLIQHDAVAERFIPGRNSSFVVIRPVEAPSRAVKAIERNAALAALAETSNPSASMPSLASQSMVINQAVIYRCSQYFVNHRELISTLCAEGDPDGLYLGEDDLDAFTRTILPFLATPSETQTSPGIPEDHDPAGSGAPSSRPGGKSHIIADIPEELLQLRTEPCVIECYLDRDKEGVICDVQARYGDESFHVFSGIDARNSNGIKRDKDTERLAVEAVRQYFPMPDGVTARIEESDDKAIYKLITEGLTILKSLGSVFATPAFDGLTDMPKPIIGIGLNMKSGLVEISPIADEIDPDEVRELLQSYRKHRRFHRLRNGTFVDMGTVDTHQLDDIADDLAIKQSAFTSGSVELPAFEAYYLDSQVPDSAKSDSFKAYVQELKVIDPARYCVPKSLQGVLRPYQAEGFRWLSAVCDKGFGGILADEMGLGKTAQLLSFLLARQNEARATGPNLIVCPASLVYNWAAEAEKFAPDLKVVVASGTKAERHELLEQARALSVAEAERTTDDMPLSATAEHVASSTQAPDVIITSYDLLRRDLDDYKTLQCYCMVLDEAQYVKNHATKSSRAVRSIKTLHRFALTGTPIENRLSELWSIFDFLMPGILGSYAHFRERFEMPILSGDRNVQLKLQGFIGPFILRRLKSEVLKDLPDKIENVITVKMQGEQRKLYAALEQRLRDTLTRQSDPDFTEGKLLVLAQLTKLRQVCCDPRLLFADAASGKGESAKLDAIEDLVSASQDAGRKMLIFSQFTSYLDLIAERLRMDGVRYDVITGATPKKKRLDLVNQFNKDDTPVFLISLKAGNTGLNLTGACVVVHADPWWNAAAQNQATDRAHRIGQTQDVNVYQVVAQDTIEERILKLQHSKSDLASRFVDSASRSGQSMSSLTKDDLLSLLS
ncbi:DEAD/DEAH box helicase [Bifidobacterium aquikefiri]|uniref:Helicase n=3 Tax=Bifidobacterium aquikefiri TaxID=1653207 RepID=A0A261GAH1_9BIFI|nr:DEAD/DEAH box helicase [Bifidobacterium aquikefiri]OZG68410.1 helicase [Bifidobacterium aquikefiri]